MAEPISIQQLKNASEDAISLAEFIYKPASAMVKRRLAPDIHTLDYYTSLVENLVIGKVRAQDVSTADGSTQNLKNTLFSSEMAKQKLDTGITATAKFGGIARTQAEKNSDHMSVKDFGAVGDGVTDDTPAFASAASASSDLVFLPSGTYNINTNEIDLSKFYGIGGIKELNGTSILYKPKYPVSHEEPVYKNMQNTLAFPRNASSVISGTVGSSGWDYSKITGKGLTSSISSQNHAWGANLTGNEWVEYIAPYGVVIGDSIAEGRPHQDGRLNDGTQGNYNPDKEVGFGAPSYELSKQTGVYWYNHGWRGQKTEHIVARWDRDVLAKEVVVGDGIPNRTLPENTLPYAVLVNIGINNNWNGSEEMKQRIFDDFRYMAKSARDNGIIIIFNTLPPNGKDGLSYEKQIEINKFLKSEIASYGAYIFDARAFLLQEGSLYNSNASLALDGLHPTKSAHVAMISAMLTQTGAPICASGISVGNEVDEDNTPPAWRDVKRVELQLVRDGEVVESTQTAKGTSQNFNLPTLTSDKASRDLYRIKILEPVMPVKWSGISLIKYLFKSYEPLEDNENIVLLRIFNDSGSFAVDTTMSKGVEVVDSVTTDSQITVKFNRELFHAQITPVAFSSQYIFGAGYDVNRKNVVMYPRLLSTGGNIDATTLDANTSLFLQVYLV